MKVAIYVSELNVRGGTHKQVLKLADYLTGRNHIVRIFTPVFSLPETYPGFSNHSIISIRKQQLIGLRKTLSTVFDQFFLFKKSIGYNVINIHDNKSSFFLLLHHFFSKAKIVWQINDLDPSFKVGNSKDYKTKFAAFRQMLAKLAAVKADLITVNVSKNADRVRQHFGVNAKTIYCGVELLQARDVLPDVSKTLRIVTTGILFRYRNYETLIKAVESFKKNFGKDAIIDIIGDVKYDLEYAEELKWMATRLGVNITLHDSVDQITLENIYNKGSLFAFLNIDQSWGLAVFEAASKKLPIILSESVGAVELLGSSAGISIVDPMSPKDIAQVMWNVTKSKDIYKQQCIQARQSVQDMSWDKMYSSIIEQEFKKLIVSQVIQL